MPVYQCILNDSLIIYTYTLATTTSAVTANVHDIVCGGGEFQKVEGVRRPGIEPGSNAWKASILTIVLPTLNAVDTETKTKLFQ